MKWNLSSVAVSLPALALLFALILGAGLGAALHLTGNHAVKSSAQQLGNILADELAASSTPLLLRNDPISVQIEVDEILGLQGVAGAFVEYKGRMITAHGEANRGSTTQSFSSPIIIDGKNIGRAAVSLDMDTLSSPYRKLLVQLMAGWAVLSIIFVYAAAVIGRRWASRLGALAKQLPESRDQSDLSDRNTALKAANRSELAQLESALEPLFRDKQPGGRSAAESVDHKDAQEAAVISVSIRNLTRLEAQLSEQHFQQLLEKLNRIVEFCARLYNGSRLGSTGNSIHIACFDTDADKDFSLRALYCAFAIRELASQEQRGTGVNIDIATAICRSASFSSDNPLLHNLLLDKALSRNTTLLEFAAIGEIIVDSETGTDPALDDIVLLEPLTPDNKTFRCDGLQETSETLVRRQLAFFRK
ncbi:MAG: hypothetical protein ACWA5K_02650 [bacterium]